jgi:hypothetical protein
MAPVAFTRLAFASLLLLLLNAQPVQGEWVRQPPWRIMEAKIVRERAWSCQRSSGLSLSAYPQVRWRLEVKARRYRTLGYWRQELNRCNEARSASPATIICRIFGSECSNAIRVARCESHLYVGAHNGQFLGLWQMGSWARARYGHGPDALTQTRAAHRYFLDAGWGPWECARIVGVI